MKLFEKAKTQSITHEKFSSTYSANFKSAFFLSSSVIAKLKFASQEIFWCSLRSRIKID